MTESRIHLRGFGSLKRTNPELAKRIASAGGRAAQQLGKAHRFTSETAREAGRKGARSRAEKRKALAEAQ